MESWMLAGSLAAVVVSAVLAVVFMPSYARWKRSKALERAAEQLGYRFRARTRRGVPDALLSLPLFDSGKSPRVRNMMKGREDGTRIVVCDYSYEGGAGEKPQTFEQTILWIRPKGATMPSFVARPEGVMDKIGSALGGQDIDFSFDLDFSDKFLVRGDNEEAIREALSSWLRGHLANLPTVSMESDGEQVIWYEADKLQSPESMGIFVQDGVAAVRLFGDSEPKQTGINLS